eukprot:1723025-Rhodomonas_salina.2
MRLRVSLYTSAYCHSTSCICLRAVLRDARVWYHCFHYQASVKLNPEHGNAVASDSDAIMAVREWLCQVSPLCAYAYLPMLMRVLKPEYGSNYVPTRTFIISASSGSKSDPTRTCVPVQYSNELYWQWEGREEAFKDVMRRVTQQLATGSVNSLPTRSCIPVLVLSGRQSAISRPVAAYPYCFHRMLLRCAYAFMIFMVQRCPYAYHDTHASTDRVYGVTRQVPSLHTSTDLATMLRASQH